MRKSSPEPIHVWLVMLRATQSIQDYATADMKKTGLGDTDFRILEALLHKGPLPVNTIGPLVHLNPGSISVAVDRLFNRRLVTRVENADDRRVRIVALTDAGKDIVVPVFRRHSALIKRVFSKLSVDELMELETQLKRVGKCAAVLHNRASGFE